MSNKIILAVGLLILAVAAIPSFWGEVDQVDGHVQMFDMVALDGHDTPHWARFAIVEMFPYPNMRVKVVYSSARPRLKGDSAYIKIPGHRGRQRVDLQDDISWATVEL